jgi:transposase
LEIVMMTVSELLSRAKGSIESGITCWLAATEDMAAAQQQGASQREIAKAVGKTVGWVNGMLKWRQRGYQDTPFGPQAKASPQRARGVQSPERKKRKSKESATTDELAAALSRAQAAQTEAAKARAEAERATDEAMQFKAEALRERIRAENAYADACAADPNFDRHDCSIHSGTRELLVKALGMLGSNQPGERDNAARTAERLRVKLNKTWNQLIVREDDDDEDLDDLDDDDLGDDDEDFDDDDERCETLLPVDDELLAVLVADDDRAQKVVSVFCNGATLVTLLVALEKFVCQVINKFGNLLLLPLVLALTHPRCAIHLASALRLLLLEVATAKRAAIGKNEKMEILYAYLSGTEFRQRVLAEIRQAIFQSECPGTG